MQRVLISKGFGLTASPEDYTRLGGPIPLQLVILRSSCTGFGRHHVGACVCKKASHRFANLNEMPEGFGSLWQHVWCLCEDLRNASIVTSRLSASSIGCALARPGNTKLPHTPLGRPVSCKLRLTGVCAAFHVRQPSYAMFMNSLVWHVYGRPLHEYSPDERETANRCISVASSAPQQHSKHYIHKAFDCLVLSAACGVLDAFRHGSCETSNN